MEKLTRTAYLGLGSNLGERERTIEQAIHALGREVGTVERCAALYASAAWGYESPNTFINTCVALTTTLSPEEILKKTQQIESDFGRISSNRKDTDYADRVLDIDLILLDDLHQDSDLVKLPHPLFRVRLFVLLPLAEIAADVVDPVTQLTVKQLLKNCTSNEEIVQM